MHRDRRLDLIVTVGCRPIVQPQHTAETRTVEISASGIAMGSVVAYNHNYLLRGVRTGLYQMKL